MKFFPNWIYLYDYHLNNKIDLLRLKIVKLSLIFYNGFNDTIWFLSKYKFLNSGAFIHYKHSILIILQLIRIKFVRFLKFRN